MTSQPISRSGIAGASNLQCTYEADQIRFCPPRRPLSIVDTRRKKIAIRLVVLVIANQRKGSTASVLMNLDSRLALLVKRFLGVVHMKEEEVIIYISHLVATET